MFSYIFFINNSHYPFISIYEDEKEVVENLQWKITSKIHTTAAGSVNIIVSDTKNIPFLDLYISLYPNQCYALFITDTKALLIPSYPSFYL